MDLIPTGLRIRLATGRIDFEPKILNLHLAALTETFRWIRRLGTDFNRESRSSLVVPKIMASSW